MIDEYAAPKRAHIIVLANVLHRARSMDLCATCGFSRCDHPASCAFFEPPPSPDALAAQFRLEDYEKMCRRPCSACGVPLGEHGRNAKCLCGCPWEAHGLPDSYGRRRCKRCRRSPWRTTPETGLCAGYETTDGAELCEEMRINRRVLRRTSYYVEYEYPRPTDDEIAAWRSRRVARENAERRAMARGRQELNAALIVGPIVDKPKRKR